MATESVDLGACWSCLCDVDVASLARWLAAGGQQWPAVKPTKPQRIFSSELPRELVGPVVDTVLARFPIPALARQVVLSRVRSGQNHPMHVDTYNLEGHWLTRIHVPVTTNADAWMLFEEEGRKIHFEAGKAYTFDMTRRHAFGNDGTSDRIHLMFDVARG